MAPRQGRMRARLRALSASVLALAVLGLGTVLAIETRFRYMRYAVLAADPRAAREARPASAGRLSRSGRACRRCSSAAPSRACSSARATSRASRADAIRQEIAALQELRRQQGLPPLWIATDQEGGGGVAALAAADAHAGHSPRSWQLHRDRAERLVAVRHYAARQGRELAALGVNLNFAPVVDLNHGIVNPEDRLTRIADARDLGRPGGRHRSRRPLLRDADADRRALHAEALSRPRPRLRGHPHGHGGPRRRHRRSWSNRTGCRSGKLMAHDTAFTMLSHARLTAIDRERPASFSDAVVNGLLRDTWKHDGILVTDDFSMGAVTLSREGAAGGAIAALNAGRRPDPGQLRPGSVFPRDVRAARRRARRPFTPGHARAKQPHGCAGPPAAASNRRLCSAR